LDKVTLGTFTVFGLLSLTLGFGAKLGREVDELFDAWRKPAAYPSLVAWPPESTLIRVDPDLRAGSAWQPPNGLGRPP
jgi:hypothetical protein